MAGVTLEPLEKEFAQADVGASAAASQRRVARYELNRRQRRWISNSGRQ